jgi:hypothetical protein
VDALRKFGNVSLKMAKTIATEIICQCLRQLSENVEKQLDNDIEFGLESRKYGRRDPSR